MEKTFWLQMADDTEVFVKKWYNPSKQPKAIVQLAHGMVEHIERYKDFAEFLVENDFVVYGNDHRGHGKTGEQQGLMGYLSDKDGFQKTTDDLVKITEQIKQDYRNTPIFLLGHSMGSFLARDYIREYSSTIDGVILSGTGFYPRPVTILAKRIASGLPPKKESNLMNSLVFHSNNKRLKNKQTDFDWLSSDSKIVQGYMDDPLCGRIPTARFFYDLMDGLTTIHNKNLNKTIRSDLPMMLISGTDDPIGDYGKGVWKTASLYHEAGLENVVTMLFEQGRHELLNEKNRDEVYQAILDWIIVHNA
ncbi:alpha/beta hydrolase [Virgibacillus doumboii]|uniref:alpha/beta hydrolase n=1 Tax=Virgibacillus doumboii TaxID=2697503 RepID=UPI0013DFAAF1|nr:alpha/beta hydrolase [Virgibacillus doumboii]